MPNKSPNSNENKKIFLLENKSIFRKNGQKCPLKNQKKIEFHTIGQSRDYPHLFGYTPWYTVRKYTVINNYFIIGKPSYFILR